MNTQYKSMWHNTRRNLMWYHPIQVYAHSVKPYNLALSPQYQSVEVGFRLIHRVP